MTEISKRPSRIADLLMAQGVVSAGSRLLTVTLFVGCLGFCFIAPAYGSVIADSYDDWSLTGTQGESNWLSGYYNLTQDTDGIYQGSDFIPFLNDGSGIISPTNHWDGSVWALPFVNFGPWTTLGQSYTHPNGSNSYPGEEHWTIRRWVSSFDGQVDITWDMSKENLSGTGVTGLLYVNGVLVDSASISGNDSVGVSRLITLTIATSDIVDLALSPVGPDGSRSDAADGSYNRLNIAESVAVPEPSLLALLGIGLAGIGIARLRNNN